jgi:glyoxylase-like metal-dependent hydrolase (beta-lactamase superfamily II)
VGGYEGEPEFVMETAALEGEGGLALVDCGTPGSLPAIEAAFERAGLRLQDLTAILVTHQDQDHIGALADVARLAPRALVYASAAQAPGIDGSGVPMRLRLEIERHEALPPQERALERRPEELWPKVEPRAVDRILEDGDVLPFCGGTVAVFTPGHMPGHVSFYVPAHKALIAGDAAVVEGGRVATPVRFTFDVPLAAENLRGLGRALEIRAIHCYHGGAVRGDVSAMLRAL